MTGYVAEQFALPEAVDMLRGIRKQERDACYVVVSGCDPLNLVGILTPGERVAAMVRNRVVFKDGVPVCSLENGNLVARSRADEATLVEARHLLGHGRPGASPKMALTRQPVG